MTRSRSVRVFSSTLAIASVLSLVSCAKESSREERKREEERRALSRIKVAEGSYGGAVQLAEGQGIPVELAITAQKNPVGGDDQPRLQATLSLGLFGGSQLVSRSTSYDWNTGEIVASFRQATTPDGGDKALELRATLKGKSSFEGQLIGASGRAYPVRVDRQTATLDEDFDQVAFALAIRGDDKQGAMPELYLSRMSGERAAPLASDMPVLARYAASIRFPMMGETVAEASDVLYDPLSGTLELHFASSGERADPLRFKLAVSPQRLEGAFALVSGQITLAGTAAKGSAVYAELTGKEDAPRLAAHEGRGQVPPRFFTGRYQASPDTMAFPAIATIDYLGREGQNTGEAPFPTFPAMRMTLVLCNGTEPFLQSDLNLVTFDALQRTARFKDDQQAGEDQLAVSFRRDWSGVSGSFIAREKRGPAQNARPQVELHATKSDAVRGCDVYAAPRDDAPQASPVWSDLARLMTAKSRGSKPLTYHGVLTRDSASLIPAEVRVQSKRNPEEGQEKPSLQVSLKLGFFGGVTVASEPAYFDWATSRVTAAIQRDSGAPLEFRATLRDPSLTDATLVGPNLGLNQLRVSTHGFLPSDETAYQLLETALPADGGGVRTSIRLTRQRDDVKAPANIDLPTLPALTMTLKTDGLAQSPQITPALTYDPLRGTIKAELRQTTLLNIGGLFLEPIRSRGQIVGYEPSKALTGSFVTGRATSRAITVKPSEGEAALRLLPERAYVGTFKGSRSRLTHRAQVLLDYPGTTSQNAAELPLETFPSLKLTLILCLGSVPRDIYEFQLNAVDHLERRLTFRGITGTQDLIEAEFSADWQNLDGIVFLREGSSVPSSDGAALHVATDPSGGSAGCNATE